MDTLFENIVNSVLLNEIKVHDKWKLEKENGKTNLDFQTYVSICLLDPTTKDVGDDFIAGKYCNWLLHVIDIEKINNRDENYEKKVKGSLQVFNDGMRTGKIKRQGIDTNINSFKSVDDFVSAMENFAAQERGLSVSLMDNLKKFEGQYEIVGESKNWLIIAPKTWETERYFGGGTKWCTVANLDYFNDYMNKGQLYITLPKNMDNKLKMQFHFEKKEFADFEDWVQKNPKQCLCNVLGGESDSFEEVCNIWNNLSDEFKKYKFIRFKDVEPLLAKGTRLECIFDNTSFWGADNYGHPIIVVKLDNKYNVVNRDTKKLLSPNQWFDGFRDIRGLNHCIKVVIVGEKWNVFSLDFGLLWKKPVDEWFDFVSKSIRYVGDNDYIYVEIGEKCNFLKMNGELLWKKPVDEWFDNVGEFENGFVCVVINNKRNFIDINGNLVWNKPPEQWFDDTDSEFLNSFVCVDIGGKQNLLNPKGKLIWKKPISQWFDRCGYFIDKFCKVSIGGKWNFISEDGELLWKYPVNMWFDDCDDFNGRFADVFVGSGKYNMKKYTLDYDGFLYHIMDKGLLKPVTDAELNDIFNT